MLTELARDVLAVMPAHEDNCRGTDKMPAPLDPCPRCRVIYALRPNRHHDAATLLAMLRYVGFYPGVHQPLREYVAWFLAHPEQA